MCVASLSDILQALIFHLYLSKASESQSMFLTWLWHCISQVHMDPLQAYDLYEWVILVLKSANPLIYWRRSPYIKTQWPTSLMVRIKLLTVCSYVLLHFTKFTCRRMINLNLFFLPMSFFSNLFHKLFFQRIICPQLQQFKWKPCSTLPATTILLIIPVVQFYKISFHINFSAMTDSLTLLLYLIFPAKLIFYV